MPGYYNFSEPEILAFIMVFIRMAAFMVSVPVFGVSLIPNPIKILTAVVLAILVFGFVEWRSLTTSFDNLQILWLAGKEAFIGVAFGLLGRMFFYALNVAGELVSISMGLANAQIMNPMTGGHSTTMDQFKVGLATLLFLGLNGHHLFFTGIIQSFDTLPLSLNAVNLAGFKEIGLFGQQIIEIGIKISAPVMVAIFFSNLTIAIVGKAVPQINVLVTSLSVNIAVGFVVMIVALPLLVQQMEGFLELSTLKVFEFFKAF